MKRTKSAEILARISNVEKQARKENKGTIAILDRRATEKLFSNEKKTLTKSQFQGSVMRTVRQLHYDGCLHRLTRGMYALSGYGRSTASKI